MTIDSNLSRALGRARANRATVTSSGISIDEGYALGRQLQAERLAAGWKLAGWKLGYTNQALWTKLGVTKPFFAPVYQQTMVKSSFSTTQLVQPRIEPEIVVGIGRDLRPGSSADEIAKAIQWAAAGMEIVACHFEDWEMAVGEAVADAGLHAGLAIGEHVELRTGNAALLAQLTNELVCNDIVLDHGRATTALGGPVAALGWLLSDLPEGLAAGQLVTTGSLTPAKPIAPGQRWSNRLHGPINLPSLTVDLK